MDKKSFKYAFQISKLIIFEVNYYKLGNNKNKYFSTSAGKFVKNKKDWETCGQCQYSILKGLSLQFWEKWDKLHLKDLTQEEYNLILQDIEKLKNVYNYIEKNSDIDIKFSEIVELSKKELKNK